MLADAGIPLGCQTVLLKGVNDDAEVMKLLMQRLLAAGAAVLHLYVRPGCGRRALPHHGREGTRDHPGAAGWTSGLAVPHFVIDAPGGGGKIPLLPEYVVKLTDKEVVLRNYAGKIYRYSQPLEPISLADQPHLTGSPQCAYLCSRMHKHTMAR